MRVIVVNDYGSVQGGAAQVAVSSLNALADRGLDVTYLSCTPPIDKSIDTRKVKVINFGYDDLLGNPSRLKAAIHGLWDFRTSEKFSRVLSNIDPNNTIIHYHAWVKSFSPSVFNFARKNKFRIVLTLHDYFTICPNGGLFNYKTQNHCAIQPMSIACLASFCDSRSYSHKLWRIGRQFLQNKIAKVPYSIKNFISVSNYSENIIRPFLHPSATVFRIPNPIDIGKQPLGKNWLGDAFTFIGRLSPEKGPTYFAQAARQANVKSVFVGSGSEYDEIKRVNPESVLVGWKDRDGVFEQLRKSRALVFPSLLHETLGLTVSEAAALGVPSIVSNGCAARESIIDGVSGFLFDKGNVESLASKMCLLERDYDLACRMGLAAYNNYWENPPTIDKHVDQLIDCYQSVMKSSP